MIRKGLVLNGKIVQIEDQTFEVHSSMSWIDVTEGDSVGDLYDGIEVTKKPGPPALTNKKKKLRDLPSIHEMLETIIEVTNSLSKSEIPAQTTKDKLAGYKTIIDLYPTEE